MAELFFDLYFQGMMKMVVDERDRALFRGMDRVAHEHARRLLNCQLFENCHLFGSRLPYFAEETLRLAGLKDNQKLALCPNQRERFIRWVNRAEGKWKERFPQLSKPICSALRKIGMMKVERELFVPKQPKKGDVWLTAMSVITAPIRRLSAERVIFCYDFNHIYHYREMGLSAPNPKPSLNLAINVRTDEWVICISEYTRKCFLKFHEGFPEKRVFVVPLGWNFALPTKLPPVEDVLSIYGLESKKYFLSLAAAAQHKNIPYAIDEFLKWKSESKKNNSIRLVLAGKSQEKLTNSFSDTARQAVIEGNVIFTGYLPDSHLPAIYHNSLAFIFPSLAEGFGLPPLEAMGYGAPVLCSNRTSLPEVVGDAALLFDPETPDALVHCFNEITKSKILSQQLISRGKVRASELTWENSSDKLAKQLRKISQLALAA